jgi:hypothetical protein
MLDVEKLTVMREWKVRMAFNNGCGEEAVAELELICRFLENSLILYRRDA